jgi:hypothetical protein
VLGAGALSLSVSDDRGGFLVVATAVIDQSIGAEAVE